MATDSYDKILARYANGYGAMYTFYGQKSVTLVAGATRQGGIKPLPSLPSGVGGYLVTRVDAYNGGQVPLLVTKLVNLGSLDISGASGTFTDGSNLGTRTEGGASNNIASGVIYEVTTTLSATPGSITITYVDQDGNTAETSPSLSLTTNMAAGNGALMPINAGDWGVRDITAAARSGGSSPTGVIKFWGLMPIGLLNPVGLHGSTLDTIITETNYLKLGAADVVGVFQINNGSQSCALGAIHICGVE